MSRHWSPDMFEVRIRPTDMLCPCGLKAVLASYASDRHAIECSNAQLGCWQGRVWEKPLLAIEDWKAMFGKRVQTYRRA